LRQLDRARYEPVVVTLKPGPVVDLYRTEGIETGVEEGISDFSHTTLEWYGGREWWRLPGKLLQIPGSIRRTRRLVEEITPDLVHLNSSTLAPVALGCARAGVPIVWHIREPLAQGYLGVRRELIRRVIHRHAARVVAISQHDADQLIPNERIHVIHNFVDFDQFDRSLRGDAVRSELEIDPGVPVVVMLGGIAEPKGTLVLVRALPRLLRQAPGVRVIVAGPPPRRLNEPGLKGLAKRLLRVDAYQQAVADALGRLDPQTRQAMIFTGIRQDIPAVLAASDCLTFPSVVPHFARPIIEAAAMAKPAVASNLGGPRELVVNGETGLLVTPNDPDALADALADLLGDRDRVRKMGEAAYQRARVMFDANTNAAATITLYDDILGPG
jgi:glycosyltransferase involved in cell wall biosynthesis